MTYPTRLLCITSLAWPQRRSASARSAPVVCALFLVSLVLGSCYHSPAEMRMWCLERANKRVQAPDENRETMVRELYLRCLEANDVPDKPLPAEQPNARR